MAFIFISDDTRGSNFHFLDNVHGMENELYSIKPVGEQIYGTLALQIFEERDYKRITFADTENVYRAAAKQGIDYAKVASKIAHGKLLEAIFSTSSLKSSNVLCHFDFSQSEIGAGTKLIRFELMVSSLGSISMMCYDFSKMEGCAYLFPDFATAKGWGEVLGINQFYFYDENDNFSQKIDFSQINI